MDTGNDTNRPNASPECKVTSSENTHGRAVLKEVLWGGIGGVIIFGIIVVPIALLKGLLGCPQLGVRSGLLLAGVLASTVLGIVLLVRLRPVLRKAAGLDRETKRAKTDEP